MENESQTPEPVETPKQGSSALIAVIAIIVLAIVGYLLFANGKQATDDATVTNNTVQNEQTAPIVEGDTEGDEAPADDNSDAVTPPVVAEKSFTVIGENYAFSPSEIRVKQGDKVTITFHNNEGFHDFVLDEFSVKTSQLPGGDEAIVEFTADKVGSFVYYCSVGQHRANGMWGTIIVE